MADKDYIERSKAMEHRVIVDIGIWSGFVVPVKAIENIPAADVRPVVHGKWIDSDEPGVPSHCSCCGYPIDRFYKTNFCPDCGADMRDDETTIS